MAKDRHAKVSVNCEYCGKQFEARKERVDKGQGRFCSLSCSSAGSVLGAAKKYVGKENACVRWNEKANRYDAYWFDPETLKRTNSTYAKWWYEMNVGEIPFGYRAGYRDGNPKNIDPDNIYAQSPADFGSKISKRLMGHGFSDETLKKMSDKKRGGHLSEQHKQNIGKASKRLWEEGVFDSVHVGENNWKWRGGIDKVYSSHYSNVLVKSVWERDFGLCQVCGMDLNISGTGEVHHIDRDVDNNDMSNLLLLCHNCHQGTGGVHGGKDSMPMNDSIAALRRMFVK